jgi:very-short-patch-repair endonuclease
MTWTHRLRHLAAEQHGVVSRAQCRAVGAGAIPLRTGLRRRDWEAVTPRVVRLAGAPCTDHSRLMAAVLDAGPGAAASHRSAASLWRLPGFRLDHLDVSRPHDADHHRGSLGRLHRTRSLPPHHVTSVDGIPVTTPARTLFDLAGLLPPARVERALDNAVATGPGVLRALHRMLPELAERGRTGITLMRELLAVRPLGYIAPASGLETRVVRLLAEAGVRARRQVDLGGDDWIGRVDLVVEGTNLVVDVDSARFHTSLLDRERDERRDADLRAAGFEPLRVTEEDVWYAPDTVVRRVLEGRSCARAHYLPSRTAQRTAQRPMPLAM